MPNTIVAFGELLLPSGPLLATPWDHLRNGSRQPI